MKRIRTVLFKYIAAALLILGAAACSERGQGRDAIRIGLPVAPATLDPRFATDAVSYRLVRLLHRALVDFDLAATPVADLARWEQRSSTHYRFFINENASFNDGRTITADDVVATYHSVLDPARASPHKASLVNIRSMSVVDPKTVDFHLERPDLLFPGTLVIGVMSSEDAGAERSRYDMRRTSGRFEHLDTRTGGMILMRRRADGARFEFHTVKDATVRALKIVNGELDIIQGNIPPALFNWLSSQSGVNARHVDGATFSYLGFNLEGGPTSDHAVRRAIGHAIDRDAIIEYIFRGYARRANAIFPPEHWAGVGDLNALVYDPERARELLAEAGYGDGEISLYYKTSSDHFRLSIATVLKSQLKNVGINLDIQSLDWGTFYGDVKNGRFQVYSLSWVGLRLPDIFRHAFHSDALPPVGANRGRYRQVETDRLIEAAEQTASMEERVRLYHALQERLLYDLPYLPLWFEDQLLVSREEIVGYSTDLHGNFDELAFTSKVNRVGNR